MSKFHLMEIVLNNSENKYLEIFSLGDLDNIHETFGNLIFVLYVFNQILEIQY